MKKIFKKLRKKEAEIQSKKTELDNAKDPLNGYWMLFPNDVKRKAEIKEIEIELKCLIGQKYTILENIQLQAEKEKALIGNSERKLTISINS